MPDIQQKIDKINAAEIAAEIEAKTVQLVTTATENLEYANDLLGMIRRETNKLLGKP